MAEHWYALHVRSRHEKATAGLLDDKGYVVYLPIVRRRRRWRDRKKLVDFPLFPGYLFVRCDLAGEEGAARRFDLLKTHGVAKIVGTRGPGEDVVPVPDREVENIRTVLELQMKVDPFQYDIKLGQTVKIKGGPLKGMEGLVVDRKGAKLLVLHVKLIQQAVAVELDPADVAP